MDRPSPVSIEEYFSRVGVEARHQRPGQWALNLLQDLRPDLAVQIRGSAIDPFHVDQRLPEFTRWLLGAWGTPAAEEEIRRDERSRIRRELLEAINAGARLVKTSLLDHSSNGYEQMVAVSHIGAVLDRLCPEESPASPAPQEGADNG
jgi:hypothetical protein